MDRNRESHGLIFSEQTGEISVYTQEYRNPLVDVTEATEENPAWEPEIVLHCLEMRQLGMIRVVGPDGNTYRLDLGEKS